MSKSMMTSGITLQELTMDKDFVYLLMVFLPTGGVPMNRPQQQVFVLIPQHQLRVQLRL
jgi:hypothetical protein